MQNQLFRIKQFTPNATQACVLRFFLKKKKNLANALQKRCEYDQIKTKIFGLKDKATRPLKREKGKNHKLPSFRCSLKFKDTFSCEIFTRKFPLFSTDIQTFDKNVNLSKANPEAENFFLAFPLAKIPRFLRRI